MNPVLRKELRSMLRERRGWLVPVVYAAVLASAVYLFFLPADRGGAGASELGSMLAGLVAVMQAFAVAIFAPLVGAGAIAGERERGTWTRLLAAPIARRRVGLGKAAAAALYVALLLAVSLPVAGLSLLFGGADLAALGGLYLTHAVLGLTLACVGLWVSTLFHRTWTAALVAVAIALGLAVFTIAVFAALGGFDSVPAGAEPPEWKKWVLYFNPGYGLALFFGGDTDVESAAGWWKHYGAMAAIAAAALALTLSRLRSIRE